jgi:hypothetical protein
MRCLQIREVYINRAPAIVVLVVVNCILVNLDESSKFLNTPRLYQHQTVLRCERPTLDLF